MSKKVNENLLHNFWESANTRITFKGGEFLKKLAMMLSVGLIAVMTTVMLTACGDTAGGAVPWNQVAFKLDGTSGAPYSELTTAGYSYATGYGRTVFRPAGRHLAIDLGGLFAANPGLRGANLSFTHQTGADATPVEGAVRVNNAEGVFGGTAATSTQRTLWIYDHGDNAGSAVIWLRSDSVGLAAPNGLHRFVISGNNGAEFTLTFTVAV